MLSLLFQFCQNICSFACFTFSKAKKAKQNAFVFRYFSLLTFLQSSTITDIYPSLSPSFKQVKTDRKKDEEVEGSRNWRRRSWTRVKGCRSPHFFPFHFYSCFLLPPFFLSAVWVCQFHHPCLSLF